MLVGARGRMFDFWQRAESGPIAFVDNFDKKIFWPKLKEITKRYEIKYDPMKQVPATREDDDQLDRLWQAGVDLVAEVGCLCTDTRRIIEFSKKEIRDVVDNVGSSLTFGRGRDQMTCYHRGFEDYGHEKNPVVLLGRILGPADADCYWPIAMSYARVPEMDLCHFQNNLLEWHGMPITPESPWEVMSELWMVAQIKDACRQVCRPGFSDGGIRCISLHAMQAAMDKSWGMSEGDHRCCLFLPHNKVEYKHLSRAMVWHTYGAPFYGIMSSYPGGLSGGPAQSAVVGVAEWILGKLLFDIPINGSWSVDAMYFSNTSKTALWCNNWQNAAVSKNTHCEPLVGGGWQMCHGLGDIRYFYEHAAGAISAVPLGHGVSAGTGGQSGMINQQGGYGVKFSADVAKAVARAKLTRVQANDLVCQLQARYQPTIDDHTAHKLGGDFRECYNMKTGEPLPWYVKLADQAKKDLTRMGLDMSDYYVTD